MTGKPEVEFTPRFVEFIPEELDERTLYISEKYGAALHKCACGCGSTVSTPLKMWTLTVDGVLVSLSPSIGSWQLPCQSHYFITRNKAVWA